MHCIMNIQILIARTLRWGVGIACLIGLVGGILYLVHHGSEPFDPSVYRKFSYSSHHAPELTTLGGILSGFLVSRRWVGFKRVCWCSFSRPFCV